MNIKPFMDQLDNEIHANWCSTNIVETTVYLVISKRTFPKLDLHETRFYQMNYLFLIKGFSISACLNM